MRDFEDERGARWEVTVGRESWGTLTLLFARRRGREIRTLTLAEETPLAAERLLGELTDAELRERLAEAVPWGDPDQGA
ncbi:MAG TPA: hypothetical protein VFS08_02095 [Gemmatimonadaceae bacterium]|nr:hypothetical protein [Gemmatimonadaceae bacterium]